MKIVSILKQHLWGNFYSITMFNKVFYEYNIMFLNNHCEMTMKYNVSYIIWIFQSTFMEIFARIPVKVSTCNEKHRWTILFRFLLFYVNSFSYHNQNIVCICSPLKEKSRDFICKFYSSNRNLNILRTQHNLN